METLVLNLCSFWLWITRKNRMSVYTEVADTLTSAKSYLSDVYFSRASTRDRGFLLPHQAEAIAILDRQVEAIS